MGDTPSKIGDAYRSFLTEAPGHAAAWSQMVQGLAEAEALDPKTAELAYLAVLAALGREGGIHFHVTMARQAGASREEVISAILVGLPAAGQSVIQCLPAALTASDGPR